LSSKFLTYRVKTEEPKQEDAAQQYQHFADWYARLNATRPGNPPPFARIELNQAVANRRLIPKEIQREITVTQGLNKTTLVARSRHIVNWRLSRTDREKITEVSRNLVTFESVSYHQFREPDKAATAKK
jgi:hypothetical protein